MATLTPTPTPTFESLIQEIPFSPSTEEGKGFLPVILRSMGHILYLVGRYDDTARARPTQSKAKEEIEAASSHWSKLVMDSSLSTKAVESISTLGSALAIASTEIDNWDTETSLANLQKLANRMAQLMANLDREVFGMRESDAGFSL